MEVDPRNLPERPLVAGLNKIRPINRAYFFLRDDGTFFCTEEREAWGIVSGANQFIGEILPRPKYVGQSDGQTYQKAMMEARDIYTKEGLQASQDRIRQGMTEEFEQAKGDNRLPRNHSATDRNGSPINLSTYGQI